MALHGNGTIKGSIQIVKPVKRKTVGYSGISYSPYIIDEKKKNGLYQQVVEGPKNQIQIEDDNWIDGTSSSYIQPEGGGGTTTQILSGRFVTWYRVGKYDYKTSSTTYDPYWSDTVPESYWYPSEADNLLEKEYHFFEIGKEEEVSDEEGAYQEDGGWWVNVTTKKPATEDTEGAFQEDGSWWVEVVERVPADTYTLYEIYETITTYTLTLEITTEKEKEESEERTAVFYPAPAQFYFKYNTTNNEIRLYPGTGVTSAVSNLFNFQASASQYKAWRTQAIATCPNFTGKYLNAANLNEITQYLNNTSPYVQYSKITRDTFNTLTNIINSD